jgi:hypothetical protein
MWLDILQSHAGVPARSVLSERIESVRGDILLADPDLPEQSVLYERHGFVWLDFVHANAGMSAQPVLRERFKSVRGDILLADADLPQ